MGDTRVASPIICKEISAGEPCAIGPGQSEGPEPREVEDPGRMREAGEPSTSEVSGGSSRGSVPAPPGAVMIAPPEVPRNAKAAPDSS
jgi:hypothetical protein